MKTHENCPVKDCRRHGSPVPALAHTKCYGGYVDDVSLSVATSTTSGVSGDFNVGGDKKGWVWPVVIGVVIIVGIVAWFKRKKS